jgi:RNA polymerase sigma-70 factor (ECF subfamily)
MLAPAGQTSDIPTLYGVSLSNPLYAGHERELITLTRETPSAGSADTDRFDAALAAKGDPQAFERLYRRHTPRVHSLARRMLSPDVADEITQDVFVRAWQKLHLFRGESSFGTWLHRLAINLILAKRADLAKQRGRYNDDEMVFEHIATRSVQHETRMDFETALARLPDGAKQVFVLHDIEGYKHEEIAELLGVTAGTSKSQLHRARMALREVMIERA